MQIRIGRFFWRQKVFYFAGGFLAKSMIQQGQNNKNRSLTNWSIVWERARARAREVDMFKEWKKNLNNFMGNCLCVCFFSTLCEFLNFIKFLHVDRFGGMVAIQVKWMFSAWARWTATIGWWALFGRVLAHTPQQWDLLLNYICTGRWS